MKNTSKILAFTTLTLLLLTACGGNSPNSDASNSTVPTKKNWYQPAPTVSWHWQLQGEIIKPFYDVKIYDIDLFDSSEALIKSLQKNNKKVICYFSAGSYEKWRTYDADKFKPNDLGNKLNGWDERWLDIRSSNVRNIMKGRLDLAQQKGCNGVETDNMDGYTNKPGFPLTAGDQLNFNRFIASEAHARNLSIGLKNDLDQISELVDVFDFAVNEQCFEYNECALLKPFIDKGKAVLNAEYKQQYINNSTSICRASNTLKLSTLILPLRLDNSFRHSCLE